MALSGNISHFIVWQFLTTYLHIDNPISVTVK